MIRALLEQLILDLDGCQAAVLVAPDGVSIDSVVVDEAVDAELLAASAADLMVRCERFAHEASGSPLDEVSLTAGPQTFILRRAGEGHRLLAVIESKASLAAAREALLKAVGRLQDDLCIDQPVRLDDFGSGVDLGRSPGV